MFTLNEAQPTSLAGTIPAAGAAAVRPTRQARPEASRFELSMVVENGMETISLGVEYRTTLFSPKSIERLLAHYRNLLVAIAGNPVVRIEELSLLEPKERHLLLDEWNRTETDYPRDSCLHTSFERKNYL